MVRYGLLFLTIVTLTACGGGGGDGSGAADSSSGAALGGFARQGPFVEDDATVRAHKLDDVQHKIDALAEDLATDGSPRDSFAEVRQATQGIVLKNLRHPAEVTEPTPTTEGLGDPPWVTGSSPTITSSSTYVCDIDAQDPDVGDSLSYLLTTAPAGMSIDTATGLSTGTSYNAQVGDRQVTVRVVDTDALSAQRA